MEYPKMLFKAGGETLCHDLPCETMTVENEEQEAHAIAEGYALTPQDAHGNAKPAKGQKAKPDPEIKVLEEHIAKLDAALVEANKRITDNQEAADKAAADAGELLKAAEDERDAAIKRAEAAEKALADSKKDKAK